MVVLARGADRDRRQELVGACGRRVGHGHGRGPRRPVVGGERVHDVRVAAVGHGVGDVQPAIRAQRRCRAPRGIATPAGAEGRGAGQHRGRGGRVPQAGDSAVRVDAHDDASERLAVVRDHDAMVRQGDDRRPARVVDQGHDRRSRWCPVRRCRPCDRSPVVHEPSVYVVAPPTTTGLTGWPPPSRSITTRASS